MKIDRKVMARKNQYLLALPAELRRHLGLVPGARVWWHIGRKGIATLSVTGQLRGGRPRGEEECRACAKYRAEIDRLRRELRDGEQATAGQLVREGFEQAVATYGKVADRLEAHREMLRDLRAMVRELVKRVPPQLPRGLVLSEIPPPDPPDPPASIEEGADTSGAQLPGVPLER